MRLLKYSIFAMVALLAACSDDKLEQEGKQPLPIKFALADSPQTRAGHNLNNDFPSGQDIMVAIDDKTYLYQTTGTNQITLKSSTKPFYPLDGSSVSISAINMNTAYFANNAITLSVNTNQSSDSYYIKSDKTWGQPKTGWNGLDSDGKVVPTSEPVPLAFRHVCAKIVVNVSLTGSSTSKIKEVKLNNIRCSYTLNNRTGAVSSVVGANDIIIYNNSSGSSQNITCAGVIPPQSINADANFITVKMTDCTLMYKLPKNTTFIGGNTYSYNIGTAVTGTNDMITLSDTLFTYNTSAQGPTITLKWGTTTLTQGTDYDFDTSSQNTATNAGTYTVKVNFKGRYCGTAQKTWKIDRINPTYTAPSTYRIDTAPTTAQNLVKAGSCSISGCTVQYSLGTASAAGTSWSSTVPQTKDAGEYYVWWRIYSTNGNYNTMNGTSPLLARIRKAPGEVICSDGTICEYSQRGSKTPVAVVVRWGSDTGNSKYTRGLAMALEDAGSAGTFKWSTEQVQRNSTSGMVENEDGSSYNGSPYNTSTYPAFQKALAYSPAAPSNTSGWFLPSSWQFNEVIWGMGSDSNTRYDTLRQLFSSRGGTNMKQSVYWTSSEKDKENAMCFSFSGYSWYATGKTNTNYVRAMLAF